MEEGSRLPAEQPVEKAEEAGPEPPTPMAEETATELELAVVEQAVGFQEQLADAQRFLEGCRCVFENFSVGTEDDRGQLQTKLEEGSEEAEVTVCDGCLLHEWPGE